MRKRKTVLSLLKVCECCGENYNSGKEDSRFCKESCRVNNFQKDKRQGVIKTPKGFICPKCRAQDLYTPAGKKHTLIRCGTCHAEWGLNAEVIYT